jgi:hypothetical protein
MPTSPYGTATTAAAGRTVEITPMTKWVNVANGETVTFIQGDNTFTWHFDALPAVMNFGLVEHRIAGRRFKQMHLLEHRQVEDLVADGDATRA